MFCQHDDVVRQVLQELSVVVGQPFIVQHGLGDDVLVFLADLADLVLQGRDVLLVVLHLALVASVGEEHGKDDECEQQCNGDGDCRQKSMVPLHYLLVFLLENVVVVNGVVSADGFCRLGLVDGVAQLHGSLHVHHGLGGGGLLHGPVESLARVQFIILIALAQEEFCCGHVSCLGLSVLAFAGKDVAHLVLADAPRVPVAAALE